MLNSLTSLESSFQILIEWHVRPHNFSAHRIRISIFCQRSTLYCKIWLDPLRSFQVFPVFWYSNKVSVKRFCRQELLFSPNPSSALFQNSVTPSVVTTSLLYLDAAMPCNTQWHQMARQSLLEAGLNLRPPPFANTENLSKL